MATIVIRNVQKKITDKNGTFRLCLPELTIPDGKTLAVLGPTGCGKTTFLRLIAGLDKVDSGTILADGISIENKPASERGIGMVFQSLALYPHFTAKKNILSYFVFKKKVPYQEHLEEDKLKQVSELLEVDLAYLLDRKPDSLSVGEQQRVALGRCLARTASLFLLDEPFSHLDPQQRQKYRVNLKKILRDFRITTVYVTHDQAEANLLGDLVAVMRDGGLEQTGTYQEIYENPANIFVAGFLNRDVDLPALNVVQGRRVADNLREVVLGVRPEDVDLSLIPRERFIAGEVKFVTPHPARQRSIIEIAVGDDTVYAPYQLDQKILSEKIWLGFKKYLMFASSTGKRLTEA